MRMPTTYPQVSHDLVEGVNLITFLGGGQTEGFRQLNHQVPFGADQGCERGDRPYPVGEVPNPSHGLGGVF